MPLSREPVRLFLVLLLVEWNFPRLTVPTAWVSFICQFWYVLCLTYIRSYLRCHGSQWSQGCRGSSQDLRHSQEAERSVSEIIKEGHSWETEHVNSGSWTSSLIRGMEPCHSFSLSDSSLENMNPKSDATRKRRQ